MNLENKKTALDDDAAIYHQQAEEDGRKPLKERLAGMTRKEKFRYLWDYYALKVGIILAVTALLGYALYQTFRPKPDVVAQMVIVDCPWDMEVMEDYTEELKSKLGLDIKKETVQINHNYRSDSTADSTAISTFLFANTLDLLVSSQEDILRYAENGVFYSLDDLPEDIRAVLTEEDFLRAAYRNEHGDGDGAVHIYAIRLDNSEFVKSLTPEGYQVTGMYMGIHPCTKERVDRSFDIIRIMFGLPIPEKTE
ncbi:MAG: hypothetical protein J5645_05640 [Lachnospiraceae bacterium]|nr:hypothetical protein [Lachnospiraceae bacterium]